MLKPTKNSQLSTLNSQLFYTFAAAKRKSVKKAFFEKADMAQLVEQRIRNAWVAGSSPAIGSL